MKYLKFIKMDIEEYSVTNNKGDCLGFIVNEKREWRFYFGEPIEIVWFTYDCLIQLAEFMKKLEG